MSEFLEVIIEATAPWALASLAILLIVMSHERDAERRRQEDDDDAV